MIPEIIQHGINGYLCDSPEQMKNILLRLLDSPEHCAELGRAARQTILDRFNLNSFTGSWNNIFEYASSIVKHRPNMVKGR
jgi:glycosyltransferase involved in cell wall biosynthesis